MSFFSGGVTRVANVRIFARATGDARQCLVCQLDYAADTDSAMIVPLATPPQSAADAVKFIDLSAYPEFFTDLANGFPIARTGAVEPGTPEFGAIESSFAPTKGELANLNERLRIPDEVWSQLVEYDDYGFAVFKIRADAQTIPPLGIEFPMRNPHLLMFPTAHVQNGEVNENTYFDHDLFCQGKSGWMRSYDTARAFMDVERAGEVIDPNQRVERFTVLGMHPNSDIVLNLNE